MSLIRQIWLLLVVTLLMAFLGSFGVWMVSSRSYLETQLRLKNADNAQSLALSLSQQKGDVPSMSLAIQAMFDTGFYKRITLKDVSGRVVFSREADLRLAREQVPPWFEDLVPVESAPGVAQVSDGWRALGQVEVVSQSGFAHEQLWQGSLKTLSLLAALGAVSGFIATFGVRGIRRPLNATVGQAQALMERRFITVEEPKVPELARLSRAMNAVVVRLKAQYDEQANMVEQLRQQAHCDALTGLSHRRHFVAQLGAALESEEGSGSGVLYLIRVVDLGAVNRLLGHRVTDHLLQKLAQILREISSGVSGAATGRLNGGDFAVCLTHSDLPVPQAEYYADAIRRAFAEQALTASVVVGATHWRRGLSVQQVLAAADSALARAESRGAFAVEVVALDQSESMMGQDQWRLRLTSALAERRIQLMQYPVVDRRGALVHHECPARLQLDVGGVFEPAADWLPMALRCGLTSQIDEAAVDMALTQIAKDGQARGVNIAPASLLDSTFVPRLRTRLLASADSAARLWLEVSESAAVEHFELVRELCKQLRPLGTQVGLEHAGERLTRIEFLFELGLDYVKLDASVSQGVAQDAARSAFVSASVGMLHGLGLKVYAEGISDPRDIPALYDCGIDGVTGPAVKAA
ncbi:MAG TPA: EAL domain-containing protein [Aquabacterium sp.]|nr:EAL domain-containing protein [Aquabacterium sp.]